MSTATFVLAVVGFAVSGGLAAVKIWETFYSRSEFHVDFVWFDEADTHLTLRFTVANRGYRADSIRAIKVDSETEEGAQWQGLIERLPVHLLPGQISPVFEMPVLTGYAREPDNSIFIGLATMRIENATGREQSIRMPNPYDDGQQVYGVEPQPDPADL